ncbi:MAG: hypothetical protein WCK02_12700 [Bacteroidota bacterium]
MTNTQYDITNAYKAAALTLLVLITTGLILFFVRIFTPDPPFPEAPGGGGIEVNLGYSDDGMGNDFSNTDKTSAQTNPQEKVETTQTAEKTSNTNNAVSDKVITSDDPDAVAIDKQKKANEKANPIQTVNELAQYKKKTNGGSSDGNTGKPGNQGKPNGDINSHSYTGDGGSGGGTGGGNGTGDGIGNGPGKGIKVEGGLKGRVKSLVKPKYDGKEEGKVVVEISIDEDGNIINVRGGVKGSNTNNKMLISMAENAAKGSKYTGGGNAAKGTITYYFVNN